MHFEEIKQCSYFPVRIVPHKSNYLPYNKHVAFPFTGCISHLKDFSKRTYNVVKTERRSSWRLVSVRQTQTGMENKINYPEVRLSRLAGEIDMPRIRTQNMLRD